MKKRIIIYSLLFFLLYLVDAILRPVSLFGVTPAYVFIATVMLSMFENERFGAVYGLIFGLLCDFTASGVFGLNALLFMAAGYIAGALTAGVFAPNFFGMVALTMISLSVFEGISCLLYSFFTSAPLIDAFIYIFLPKVVLSAPFVAVLYPLFRALHAFTVKREEKQGTW